MAEHSETHESHDEGHHHGAHVASPVVLLGTFGTLICLTILTVVAAGINFGSPAINLVVAMIIAAIKASLVCMFFMHLRYDRLLHSVIFIAALLFFLLFISFAVMDSSQYLDTIRWNQAHSPQNF